MDRWRVSWVGEGKTAFVFLAAFRGFALVVAAALLFSTGYFNVLSWPGWILVGIAGVYTLFKLLRPFSKYKKNALNHIDFGFDLALCFSLPMLTGGLLSPFLLYMLSPLLTAALLFPKKLTFSIAGLPLVAVVASQQLIYGASIAESFNPPELAFGLLAVYLVGSFLLAWLPYVMNINESQNIKAQAIVEERNRLSRDMHDGLAQALHIIRWKTQLLGKTIASRNTMQAVNELNEITEMLEATQHEAKAVIDQLHTTIKSDQSLAPTLAQYATDFTRQYGIRCEFYVADGLVKLSSLAELELLCVAQEALSNARKHAEASVVQLSLESKSDGTEMTIKDNGRGFDPDVRTKGYGLTVMQERVMSIGGQLSIKSSSGRGTEVTVKLPASQGL